MQLTEGVEAVVGDDSLGTFGFHEHGLYLLHAGTYHSP